MVLEPEGTMRRKRGGDAGPACPACGNANMQVLVMEAPRDEEPMAPPMPAYYACPACKAQFAQF